MTAEQGKISVVIADDHPVVLRGIVALLDTEPDIRVVAECSDGEAAFESVRRLDPDIALLDFRMPKLNGLEVLAKITENNLRTRVVFLTASASDGHLLAAITQRVHGLVLKESAAENMIKCLREVVGGRRSIPDELLQRALKASEGDETKAAPSLLALTARENLVLRLAVDGLSNKEIARKLGTTEGTVKVHLHNIYEKTGVKNRTALAALAWRFGRGPNV
jgi:DNA-binding NarL/FixJ family response regulator